MPATDKKIDKRSKATGQQKTAKQQTQSVYDVTVKDCLVWPSSGSDSKDSGNRSEVVYVSLRTQKQGNDEQTRLAPVGVDAQRLRRDDGTVIDALRGWPRHQQLTDEQSEDQPYDIPADAGDSKKPDRTKLPKSAAIKAKSGKSHKRATAKEPDNVHVGDLISQRYLHEYMEQRQAEEENERLKKEVTDKAAKQGRRAAKDRRDIKANKAAQLRAIALADQVETSPFELWKMEKFTKNARPHLSTFRTNNRQGLPRGVACAAGSRSRQGSALDTDEFNYGPCLCPDHQPYYYSETDYNEVGCEDDTDPQLQSLNAACVACAI